MASSSSSSSSSEDSAARRARKAKRKARKQEKKEKKRRRKEEKKAKKRRRADSPEDVEIYGSARPRSGSVIYDEPVPVLDAHDAREAAEFKAAVLGNPAPLDVSDDDGPMPLPEAEAAAAMGADYGQALRPGEGAAIAAFVQKNMRVPRRGEIGLKSTEIEKLEAAGYVLSGSRHSRMNAVRIRKENQVYSAEEKRALALITFEEKQQAENKTMSQFRDMLTKRLRDQDKDT